MPTINNRSPITHKRVKEYLLVTLISFAGSVSLTRLFLEVTGYPQLGGGELHIAHVLWGGLILFLGSLLPLIFTNRWALDLSALFSGIGVGLFIDEVGKFITQTNDYFYPSAAPIIYAFFLLTVLLYVQFKKPRKHDARTYLYAALTELEELLDNDLSIKEHREIIDDLVKAKEISTDDQLKDLSQILIDYLNRREMQLVPHKPRFWEKIYFRYRVFEAKWLSRKVFRIVLVVALAGWGLYSILGPWAVISSFGDPEVINQVIQDLINQQLVRNPSGLTWFEAQIALEGTLGLISLVCSLLLFFRREGVAIRVGIATMLIMLTVANLLLFYFDQFSTIVNASLQFIILILLLRYQTRFKLT